MSEQQEDGAMSAPVMTVCGAYDSHKKTGEPYDTMTVAEVMQYQRTNVAKDKAQWVLCSGYNQADGRTHKVQRESGTFAMLAVDLDTGNVTGKDLKSAIVGFTGPGIAARIYSSSSATKANRKWRVLIPTTPTDYAAWHLATLALYRHLEKTLGVSPDYALARAAQPIYLPNTAPRMDGATPLDQETMVEGKPLGPSSTLTPAALAAFQEIEAEQAALAEAQRTAVEDASRRLAAAKALPMSDKTPIQAYNESHDLESVLISCGYKSGKGGWRSPLQSTASFATRIMDEADGQAWVSMSASDLGAGLGQAARSGDCCFGDAFDVFAYFQHGNNRDQAIKAAADMLGMRPAPTAIDQLQDRVRANLAKQSAASLPPASAPSPAPSLALAPQVQPANKPRSSMALAMAALAADHDPMDQLATRIVQAEAQEAPQPASATHLAVQPEATAAADIDPTAPVKVEPKLLSYVQASNLPGWEPPQELIEGTLIQGGMTVVYGDSNTGKSFLVLDMVAHVSLGRTWFGRRVKQSAAVYLAAESPRSIVDRARALEAELGERLDQLFIVNCPIDMHDPNGDTMAVVDTIAAIEAQHGVKVRVVVADTLARVMGAGDENKAMDMGVVVKHMDLVRAATGCQFIIIHHAGKDSSKGARGSSALRAATDTEIEVKDMGGEQPKEFRITKQRDLPGKNEVQGFILKTINLGSGVFDNLITTCVVQAAEAVPQDPADYLKDGELEILDMLKSAPMGGLRYQQIIDQVQTVSTPTAKRYIRQLRKQGLIYDQSGQLRVGNGKTNVRQPGQEF